MVGLAGSLAWVAPAGRVELGGCAPAFGAFYLVPADAHCLRRMG